MNARDINALRLFLSSEVAVVCDTIGIIRWADEPARRLLGIEPEIAFADLAAPGSEVKARHFLEAACAADTGVWELFLRVNTDLVVMAWRGAPVPDGAVLVGNLVPQHYSELHERMAAVLSDLTVLQRETERSRRQVEEARRARDVFLSTLAHDLKTPLVNLSWHLQVLDSKLRTDKLDLSSLASELEFLRAGVAETMSTIDELYDLARTATDALVLNRQTVDLVLLVDGLVRARRESLHHMLAFETAVQSLAMEIDAARLTRAILNLIDNAAKYSRSGERVTVVLDRVYADGISWAKLSVRDYGIGIPGVDLPHIFEAYYRGSNVGLTTGQGLGLASAQGIVKAHGGRIEVRSVPGDGTVMTMWLPATGNDSADSR